MSVLRIICWPDPRLAEVCTAIEHITPQIETLANDMLETMYAAQGRGLAGPQVGAMLRLFVMDIGWKEGRPEPLVCINPSLQDVAETRATGPEGCLSIPGVTARISRPTEARMVWTGLNGARHCQNFDGFGAICVQHELDHLNGIVTFDHLDKAERDALVARYHAA